MVNLGTARLYLENLKKRIEGIENYLNRLEKETEKEPRQIWVLYFPDGTDSLYHNKRDAEKNKPTDCVEMVEYVEVIE